MGKVTRTKTEETPQRGIHHRRKFKLVLQITEFFLHPTEIIVGGFSLQQTGLSEEESFHLCQIVTMLINGTKREQICPSLKSIAIQAETEITGKSDKEGIFPMTVTSFQPVGNLPCFLLQSFGLKSRQPGVNR